MRHVKLKYFIFFLPFLLASCHGSKNDFSVRYEYNGMNVENAQNLGSHPVPTTLDSIPSTTYAIRVNLDILIHEQGRSEADYDHPVENKNRIDSILVTSSQDFDINSPSGSSLNDKFMCFNGSYFSTSSLDILKLYPTTNNDYMVNSVIDKFDLLLITPPALQSIQKFTVQLFLKDGTVLTDSTNQVTLN